MYSSTHSLTSALHGGEWSASRTGCFTPRERAPGTHWIGWVGPRRQSNPRTPIVHPYFMQPEESLPCSQELIYFLKYICTVWTEIKRRYFQRLKANSFALSSDPSCERFRTKCDATGRISDPLPCYLQRILLIPVKGGSLKRFKSNCWRTNSPRPEHGAFICLTSCVRRHLERT
jgi:hypothetical protein